MAEATLPVVTTTSYTPALRAGAVAVQLVADEQLTPVAGVPPTATLVLPGTKFVPVIVIAPVAPATSAAGLTPVTVGAA